jgi:glycerol uptake facilitator-like aquaporin
MAILMTFDGFRMILLGAKPYFTTKVSFIYFFSTRLGVCGAAMIYGVASDKAIRESNLAVNLRNPDVSVGQALGMEIWIGFILTLVVFSATDPGRTKLAGYGPPLSIGFSVFINLNMSVSFKNSL